MDSENGQPTPEVPKTFGYTDRGPEALEVLEEHLQKRPTPAGLDYKELGACQTRGSRTAHGHGIF